MKHLRTIFESNEDDKKYIEECFFDISENPNFEVDDLTEVPFRDRLFNRQVYLKLHIELGKNLSLPQPISSNLYIGMVETNLEFLKMKNEKLLELYNDIEVAIERIKDRFQNARIKIETNRREEINILVYLKN